MFAMVTAVYRSTIPEPV